MGLFPLAKAQKKFIIMVCEYFTKWIEAEAVTSITGKSMKISYRSTLSTGLGSAL